MIVEISPSEYRRLRDLLQCRMDTLRGSPATRDERSELALLAERLDAAALEDMSSRN
jgi:hypothetical protein